jgi:hypothetical protein
VVLTLAVGVYGQEPGSEPQKLNLKWRVEPGRKILVDRSHTETRNAEFTIPNQPLQKKTSRIQDRQRYVDWQVDATDDTPGGPHRRFLRWDVTKDDGPLDPSFIGVTVRYGVKNGETIANILDGAAFGAADVDALLQCSESFGGKLPMPETANVGEEIMLDLKRLVPALFLEEGDQTKRAKARLKVGTPKGDIVPLSGTLEMFGEDSVAPFGEMEGETTANMEVQWDMNKGYPKSIKLSGKSLFKTVRAESGYTLNATATFTIELTAVDGAPAESALKAPIKFRDNARVWGAGTLRFKLPSHWWVGKDELQAMQLHSKLGTKGDEVRLFKIDEIAAEGDPKKALAAVRPSLEDLFKTKAKSVRSSLGEGIAMEYDVDGRPMRMEIYPDKDRHVRIQVMNVKPLAPGSAAELEAFRKSLSRVP